jgi:hypothetical protein
MLLLAVAVAAGLIVGWARRPAGAFSTAAHVDKIGLLALAAGLDAAAVLLSGDPAVFAMAGAYAVLLAFASANHHLTGVVVMAVGILLNLAGLVMNQGMPVRQEALVQAGVVEAEELATTELGGPRHLETDADVVPSLGDVLPVPLTREVVSFGDLVIAAGAADTVAELARRRRRRWSEAEREAYRSRITQASVDQLCGTAPSPVPVSGSQYSANPETDTPVVIDLSSSSPSEVEPALVAATHSR